MDTSGSQPPKGVTKTLRQLAKQLTKKQGKQAKAAAPTPLTAKRARKALAGEMATVLQPFLSTSETPDAKAAKGIAKTVKRLAAQVLKQRRKEAKQNAKQAKQEAKHASKADGALAAPVAPASAAKKGRPSVARAATTASRRPASATKPTATEANAPALSAAEPAPAK
ncbi:hypothetical protein ACFST9_17145 [Hymenobacter monticola]|uniref:Uncharacterized protein n=1 Tax=Hymenobacter monticola TaxID=1705399 RepID=A0ABY4B6P1_9BACT|nr:hypothetical protein [Hymenobacter monticola]UOE32365.1 hypothetical protein MTP16_14635 [Hymenobacter monticola]